MMFSETPLMGSTSAWDAASINTSTVSSKEHLQQDISTLICNIHTPKENTIKSIKLHWWLDKNNKWGEIFYWLILPPFIISLCTVFNWNLYRLTDWRLTNTWQYRTQYVEFRKIIPLLNINQTFISQTLQVKNGVKDPSWIHFYLLPMYANTSQQRICLWPCPPPHEDVFGQFYTIVYNI